MTQVVGLVKIAFVGIRFKRPPENIVAVPGPVVQSIVRSTSSLTGNLVECFTTLYYQIHFYFLLKK